MADPIVRFRVDVADAARYAREFGARVWIHEDDCAAASYATDILEGTDAREIGQELLAIPVPGHTRGSVVYLWRNLHLFTGDSPAWRARRSRGVPRCLLVLVP